MELIIFNELYYTLIEVSNIQIFTIIFFQFTCVHGNLCILYVYNARVKCIRSGMQLHFPTLNFYNISGCQFCLGLISSRLKEIRYFKSHLLNWGRYCTVKCKISCFMCRAALKMYIYDPKLYCFSLYAYNQPNNMGL